MHPLPYTVEPQAYDASRPFAVVATFRTFNKVIERYAVESQAKRHARDLNRRSTILPMSYMERDSDGNVRMVQPAMINPCSNRLVWGKDN